MNETEFRQRLKESLERELGNDYSLEENRNLIYKVIIGENLEYEPNDPKNPKRGDYAFQTDIVIAKRESNLPLVIIETKYGGFSSHDVLTYSTKALKHKEIYPYIRYGLVVGGKDKIDNKFFTHNIGFDFAIALKELEEADLQRLSTIIREQLESAKLLLDIFANKKRVKEFNSVIKVGTENKKNMKGNDDG
jgi:hypothetical protein